jgi:hypothetical protein
MQAEGDKWQENIIYSFNVSGEAIINNKLISGKPRTYVCLNDEREQMEWTRFSVNKFFFAV